jgi:SAM-dependent methyltransferase
VSELYDEIGVGYTTTRQPDPRIERAIHAALGDAASVVNVGAGAGSYEPRDRAVTAVEPSEVMIAQRPPGAAPVVRGVAERLPFPDGAFDASMAVITDHHWRDRARGLRELRRVASRRAVLLTYDPRFVDRFWLTRDYLPGFSTLPGMAIDSVAAHLGAQRIEPVPIPADCRDGFMPAWWARPEAYLDARVRAGISVFARLSPEEVSDALARLRADLDSGAWHERNAELVGRDALDLGFRLVVAEYGDDGPGRARARA